MSSHVERLQGDGKEKPTPYLPKNTGELLLNTLFSLREKCKGSDEFILNDPDDPSLPALMLSAQDLLIAAQVNANGTTTIELKPTAQRLNDVINTVSYLSRQFPSSETISALDDEGSGKKMKKKERRNSVVGMISITVPTRELERLVTSEDKPKTVPRR